MKVKKLFVVLMREESGQDLIEYALISALIGLAAITTMGTLAGKITALFTTIAGKLP